MNNLFDLTRLARTRLVFDGPSYWSCPRDASVENALARVWVAATFASVALERLP